ncbi:hypothetical protein K2Q00_02145 [Patescibacteria group bacterium]|nr:hypothetical protein [Patescibacteria group bacterium]
MSQYKPLSVHNGVKHLPHIWSMFFKARGDAHPFEPEESQDFLRHCAIIAFSEKDGATQEVIFCTADPEMIQLFAATQEVTLYGSYNQVNVSKMKVEGTIIQLFGDEADKAKALIWNKVSGSKAIDPLGRRLAVEDVRRCQDSIKAGSAFRFMPSSYALSSYERG